MGRVLHCVGLALAMLLGATSARAAEIIFQPGPSTSHDIWTTSVYSYAPGGGGPGGGLANDLLRVGGWGDEYDALMQFDLGTLPTHAASVQLRLYNVGGGNPTPMTLARIDSAWDWKTTGTGADNDRLWWADRPAATDLGGVLSPSPVGSFDYVDITDLYNQWQTGAVANYGVELRPVFTFDNNFNQFASSRADDPFLRPALVIRTTEAGAPDFGFPVEGAGATYVTTMAGGVSSVPGGGTLCGIPVAPGAHIDPCHTAEKANYAIDLAVGKDVTNAVVAAGSGTVVFAGAVKESDGVYYPKIVIDHGPIDGSAEHYFSIYQEFAHGSQADALALASQFVAEGQTVREGQKLGDLTYGEGHLHFQVGYGCGAGYVGCSSTADAAALSGVKLEGRLLTDFTLVNAGSCHVTGTTVNPECAPSAGQVGSSLNPFAPRDEVKGASLFSVTAGNLGLGVDDYLFVDPAAAIGYDFEIAAGPAFAGLLLPDQVGGAYDLWLYDDGLKAYYFDQAVAGGSPFDFGPGGVMRFRILGVRPPPGGGEFITGLKFVLPGEVTFTQTPLFGAVPEPSIWALMLAGFGLVGWAARRRGAMCDARVARAP